MPSDEELAEVRRAAVALERAVAVLRARHTDSLGLRRLASDVSRFADDLAELGELRPVKPTGDTLPRLQFVPDQPYDPGFWRDADDEGVGGTR
jgi:hypothetical protein